MRILAWMETVWSTPPIRNDKTSAVMHKRGRTLLEVMVVGAARLMRLIVKLTTSPIQTLVKMAKCVGITPKMFGPILCMLGVDTRNAICLIHDIIDVGTDLGEM